MHTCSWNQPIQVSDRVIFCEIEWTYHCFSHIKKGKWHLKIFWFNYWKDLALGSVETVFLEVGAYVFLKPATTGVWEGRFCWMWVKTSLFSKYENRGVGPKKFLAAYLKWFFPKFRKIIFFGSRCIRVSETSHQRCLSRSFLLNLSENITVIEIENRVSGTSTLSCWITEMILS